jgi:5-methylcytosine-specific restriction endonuclease McrA
VKRTELKRGRPLQRHTPLPPASRKRQREKRERAVLLAELGADQQWCSRCGVGTFALDGHELLRRSAGGSITDPENIVLLCRPCHDDVTFRAHEIPDADVWTRSRFVSEASR